MNPLRSPHWWGPILAAVVAAVGIYVASGHDKEIVQELHKIGIAISDLKN